jgi:hypothetical protein
MTDFRKLKKKELETRRWDVVKTNFREACPKDHWALLTFGKKYNDLTPRQKSSLPDYVVQRHRKEYLESEE